MSLSHSVTAVTQRKLNAVPSASVERVELDYVR